MSKFRNELYIAGKSLKDFGVFISGKGTYQAPERDYELVSVPGRNGDLVFDNHRFKNIEITYPSFITEDFDANYSDLVSYLLSNNGYQRINDTYHPDYYRLGVCIGPVEPDMTDRLGQGSFDLTFNCKPQKFLFSGEKKIVLNSTGSVLNPTRFASKPLLRVYGAGDLMIGSQTITISKANGYTDIDCDSENAYKDEVTTNCNANVSVTGDSFPVLQPGKNGIQLGKGITQVDIVPRWYTI